MNSWSPVLDQGGGAGGTSARQGREDNLSQSLADPQLEFNDVLAPVAV